MPRGWATRTKEPLETVQPEPETIRNAKPRWAELLRRILQVDPLVSSVRRNQANRLGQHRTQDDRPNPRAPATRTSLTPTPARAAEKVEIGSQHGFGLEAHPNPRAFVAQGIAGLPGCANSTRIVDRSLHQSLSESATETSRTLRQRLDSTNPSMHTCERWIEMPKPNDERDVFRRCPRSAG